MYRKITPYLNEYLENDHDYILCIDGARQTGKTYIIKELASSHFKNYIEINMVNDKAGNRIFEKINTVSSFYLALGSIAGAKLGNKRDTIVFLDEIQVYPELFTLLKQLKIDDRYKYICSGSELGIALGKTTSIPMGSILEKKMYPLDFEEFLLANSLSADVISHAKECFEKHIQIEKFLHNRIFELFKTYLLIGGMPAAVKEFLESENIVKVREIQQEIISLYGEDASKYDKENKLRIKRIYDLVPSNMENKVKRIHFKDIDGKTNRFTKYENEFDYLLSSGIVLGANAISEPKFPLLQSTNKNLIKLYLNDVGLLTCLLYKNNIQAVKNDMTGVNLGSVYESVVAQELKAHDHKLFYYDRKSVGEVDYLVDDYADLSILPIEIKSGKDYANFRALPKLVSNENYRIKKAYVMNNNPETKNDGKIYYTPIYNIMFI